MTLLQQVTLFIALCACHATVRPGMQHGIRGTVRFPSGEPARAAVTVTDVQARREVMVVHDVSGVFTLDVPPGDYAFAVTSKSGFAYVDKLTLPIDDLAITLSSACHRIQGRVVGRLAHPATVSLSRISRHIGDRFVAPVGKDGGFSACLADGTYSTRIEGAMVSLASSVEVPTGAVIELAGYVTSEVQRAPTNVHAASIDLRSFAMSLRDRRILGLGEANHGTGDFYTQRGALSLELARSGNLRTILLEADAIAMMTIDDYVMGGSQNPEKAVADIGFWITDIREFLVFLGEVRAYNASVLPTRKIRVLGIDAQRIEPPARFLLAHRAELAISDQEAELLEQVAPDRGAAFAKLSSEASAVLLAVLDRLATPAVQVGMSITVARASIAARSIRHQVGYVGKSRTGALRDIAMADLAAYIAALNGSSQAAVWAHNGHIARQPDGAIKSLGQHLHERFGEGYYPIAFLSYRGDGRAWDEAGKIGVISHELLPAPQYNVESVMMRATRFVDVAWVRLDTANAALKQWLSFPRYVREFGSAYHPKDTQTLRTFPAAIAAVVVIQRAKSSTPTPTGVRMVRQ